jgi:hypothetical protein
VTSKPAPFAERKTAKASGGGTMAEFEYPWQKHLQDAMDETDMQKLC